MPKRSRGLTFARPAIESESRGGMPVGRSYRRDVKRALREGFFSLSVSRLGYKVSNVLTVLSKMLNYASV